MVQNKPTGNVRTDDRRYDLTQPSYREVGVRMKRVGDIEVVKRSGKSYVTILSG
jgi:hypothetical protein